MEIDILIHRFRLASRELFNHYFHVSTHDEDAWIAEERFNIIEENLFKFLVTEPANLPDIPYREPQPNIRIVPRNGDFAPWLLNREIDSGYWDYPLNEFTHEAVLIFCEFFDWDQIHFKDNLYVLVEIKAWSNHSNLVGKQALIEWQYVRFTKLLDV
jgi:hypothetical protein